MNNKFLRILSGSAALAAAGSFSLSVGPAFAVTHGLAITSLTNENPTYLANDLDDQDVIGDDRGGIALTSNGVLNQGDDAIALFNFDLDDYDLSDLTQDNGDALFTDLGTNTSYFFNWEYNEPADEDGVTTFSSFTNVTDAGNVGDVTVELSEDLSYLMYDFDTDSWVAENFAVLNGNGIVGIWDMAEGDLAIIDIATGAVTHQDVNTDQDFLDAGATVHPLVNEYETAETFAQWAVLEYDGTNYSYVGPAYDDVADDVTFARFPLTDAASDTVETLATEVAGEDIWRIVPDCLNGRWYAHSESMDETIYSADVTCTVDAAELGETGFDASTALGFVAASIAAGGLLVLRRRARS
ncbi:MAG: hypothetical protein ACKOWN_00055 [Microbacteriaceae bacterium]